MASTLNQILRWLMQPNVWRYLCFASSVVGLLCYALSPSFSHLIGKWSLLKIFLYSVFSFIICLAVLFPKSWQQCSTNLWLKAHLSFLVLTTTSMYSFFFDKVVNEKPDAYSLISCAAFAIMSLGLSKQTHFGFEVDLLYFFCGFLTVQLMKLKLLLVIVGAGFSYSLIILRSSLDAAAQVDSDSEETNTDSAIQVVNAPVTQVDSHPQQSNFAEYINRLQLDFLVMNLRLNSFLWNHVEIFLYSNPDYKTLNGILVHLDELPFVDHLREIAELMGTARLETRCRDLYSNYRSEFLSNCLETFGLKVVNLKDVKKWEIGSLIDAFNVVLRILFPFERRLWRRLFSGFNSAECNIFSSPSDWTRTEFQLWTKFLEFETGSVFHWEPCPACEVHPITREVMNYLRDLRKDWIYWSSYIDVPVIMKLLESNLEAKSRNYPDPVLGYIFMVTNGRYIQRKAKDNHPLQTVLGDDWDRRLTSYLERYIGISRSKILESDESAAAELMEEKLDLFDLHFEGLCKELAWCVIDVNERQKIRSNLEDTLFQVYQTFIGMFSDVLGNHIAGYVRHRMLGILNRVNHFHGFSPLKSGMYFRGRVHAHY